MIETAVLVGLLIGICILVDSLIMVLTRIIPKYTPTVIKNQPYESGNPSIGAPKYIMPMPYTGFLIMFAAMEPIAVLFLVFAAYPTYDFIVVFGLALVLMLPALYVGYQGALRLAYNPKSNHYKQTGGTRGDEVNR